MKPTALLIDDDLIFSKAMEAVLRKFDVTPVPARSSADFLEQARSIRPSLFFIDLFLAEGESGFDLISRIRQELRSDNPIIVISGSEDPKSVAHALELGATDFIFKPLDKEHFASKLSRYVSTAGVMAAQARYLQIPNGPLSCKLSFDNRLVAVDELGVTLEGPHLLPKGTVVWLNGEAMDEICGKAGPHLVTVASTSLEIGGDSYVAYAEFDDPSPELIQSIRRWLSKKGLKQAWLE